ncbi:MAG TPA: VWA domain-containing protein [Archaeoglobaceae archaeon]|nr:VWA domain-containing protein [Archaeoglobaceae archaeon]
MWVDDGSLHGYYTDSSPFEDSNAGGTYTVYVVADFPYGSQEFELTSYIAKIDAAKIAAKTFNGILRDNDLVGVAYFNGTGGGWIRQAEVVQSLTQNKNLANSSIDGLSAYGGTPMGDGIWVAERELEANSSECVNCTPVIILLSDGNPTLPSPSSLAIQLALQNATNAKNTQVNGENIIIYTIGFGSDANETLLQQIATSSSYYHFAATADEFQDIYEQVARELLENAGTNITITDVLPSDIELSSVPEGATITYTDDGRTIIQWNISTIKINQTWTASFYVKPQTEGTVETNVYGLSNVTYLPTVNATSFRTIYLPSGQLRVERLETERVELK